jgi:hypothetical protein
MTPAQRQARHWARPRRDNHPPPAPPARRTPPRPQRWAAAVAASIDLQDEYRVWLDTLPANLNGSRLAEKLQAIAEIDLEELRAIAPPRLRPRLTQEVLNGGVPIPGGCGESIHLVHLIVKSMHLKHTPSDARCVRSDLDTAAAGSTGSITH